MLKPWEGMEESLMKEMVSEVLVVLEPLFASAIAAGEAILNAEAAQQAAVDGAEEAPSS
jgi:hypothetical protein